MDHPLVQHKLTLMRKNDTSTKSFRELVHAVSALLPCEITCDMPMHVMEIETPLETMKSRVIDGKRWCSPPSCELATAFSTTCFRSFLAPAWAMWACTAIRPHTIRCVCLVTCPQGIKTFHDVHPDVPIYTPAVNNKLNEHGGIVPGLGDADDRIFGTQQNPRPTHGACILRNEMHPPRMRGNRLFQATRTAPLRV